MNHVKKALGISGNVEITITNAGGRAATNLVSNITIAPKTAPVSETPVYRTPEPTKAIVVNKPEPITDMKYTPPVVVQEQVVHTPAVVEQQSEVEAVLAKPPTLDFSLG